jgi:rhodanese-related sulfurtransferase
MTKQRHDETGSSSNLPMIVLVVGVLVVGGLVAWALTRTVEVAPTPVAQDTAAAAIATAPMTIDTASTNTPPLVDTSAASRPSAPGAEVSEKDVQRMSVEDAHAKWNRHEITMIDVRHADAFAQSHIPGSLAMPLASLEGMIDMIPKDKTIVLYCTCPHDESSVAAAQILIGRGVKNVFALYGGLDAWRSLGYPTESGMS